MTIEIMDYEGNIKPVNIDFEEGGLLTITIKSGDEILTYVDSNGNEEVYDSCDDRIYDFYDGEYDLDVEAEWFEQWKNRDDSYEGHMIANGLGELVKYLDDEEEE